VGYNTVSVMASASEYQNLIGDTALVYGTSGSVALAFNRLLYRDQTSKTALDLSLTRRHSRRAINNLSLSPQRQTVARLGVNRLERWQVADGTAQSTMDLGLSRGLRLLGADRDEEGLDPQAARAQFTKLEFSTSLDRPLSPRWLWRARLAGQWSVRPLFSSEQLFAGGVSSVRGLPDSAVGDDRGLSARNEWVWLDAPALPWPAASRLEPYVFLDGARLQTVADGRWQNVLGGGAGLRLAWGGGHAELILGRPLKQPADLRATGWRVHAQVQLAL
jgi:hemolysin activation/secretion protein